MSADLIVMAFEGEMGAKNAHVAMQTMREGLTSGLDSAVLVSCSSAGETVIDPADVHSDSADNSADQLTNLFARTFFGQSGGDTQHLADAGLDRDFLSDIGEALVPDCSVLLVFVPEDSPVDKRRLIYIMSLLEGNIFHTSFPPAVETALLQEVKIKRDE